MGDEILDDVLLAQPVAAADGVVEMRVQTVMGLPTPAGPTLRADGVAAHRVDLGEQRDAQRRIGLGRGDRRPQPGAPGADDGDIGLKSVPSSGLLLPRAFIHPSQKITGSPTQMYTTRFSKPKIAPSRQNSDIAT